MPKSADSWKKQKRDWQNSRLAALEELISTTTEIERLLATERLAPIRRYQRDPLGLIERIIGPDEWVKSCWTPWKVFLKSFFAIDPDRWSSEERRIYGECTGRQDFPEKRAAEAWAIIGRRGGKALALDTKLPTPSGWTTMGRVAVGDILYDERGRQCRVIAAHPVMLGRPCYRVSFSDGSAIVADADHLWATLDARARKERTRYQPQQLKRRWNDDDVRELCRLLKTGLSKREIAVQINRTLEATRHAAKNLKRNRLVSHQTARLSRVITTEEIKQTLYKHRIDGVNELNHAIECCASLVGITQALPADPYLLGLWLGDGSRAGATITTADPEIIDAFRAAGFDITERNSFGHSTAKTYGICLFSDHKWEEKRKFATGRTAGRPAFGMVLSENTFTAHLRKAGVLRNKHIPSVYLRAATKDRVSLLQGLMDTDGYCDDRGHCEYTSTNWQLARDVWELALSLGLKATISHERAKFKGRDISPKHRVIFIAYRDFPVFRLPRKLERQRIAGKHSEQTKRRYITAVDLVTSVPVRCITVDSPSELFLAGETMIPTHNSRIFSAIATYFATAIDWRPYLAPGERGYIPIIAPDRRQAQAMMGYISAPFLNDPLFKAFVVSEPNSEQIELVDGVTIEVMTCSHRSIRSRTVLAALCDELGFWPKGESASPDTEVLAALKPCMATIPNAPLLGASSPYDRRGVLWDQYSNNFGKAHASSLVWQAATTVMNSTISQSWVDEQLALDYEKNSAEYLATFRRDITAFVTKEVVDAAVQPGRFELPPQRGVNYLAFVDPSGGSADSCALSVAHCDAAGRGVLDMIREVIPPFDPESVVRDFSQELRRYGLASVEGDFYGGDWVGSRFADHGIIYNVAEKTKSQIYTEFLPLLNAGQVEYLDNRRLIQQTLALERRTARGGRDSIDHPPQGRDDVVNCAAGVLIRAAHGNSGAEQLRRFLGG